MAAGVDPQPRSTAIRIALSGISNGDDLGDISAELWPLHPQHDTFPGEVLLDLAADAIEESGATRDRPLGTERIRKRLLPEDRAKSRADNYKINFTIRAAAMVRAGVDPALLENASWAGDDLWFWSLEALVIYIRAAAEHADTTVSEICQRLAKRHSVSI